MDFYQYQRGYPHAHKDFYFGRDCEGWMDKNLSKSQPLHSQSIQTVRKQYFKSWKSYSVLKKTSGVVNPKPPNKRKNYLIPKNFDMSKAHLIATVDLCYHFGNWELHFTYIDDIETPASGSGIVGVDIGEIHPIVSHDGQHTDIYNGRYIRSLYRQRNKVLAAFSHVISRCQRHSKRWWQLTRRKWKRIRKIENQIKDALNKHTTKFVSLCQRCGIGRIVLGDLTGIRENINYGKRVNQKLHQWAFAKVTRLVVYKAKAVGIKVEQIDEAYTSQTCPKCGIRKKPTNRNYTCPCGFKYHRDGVGAINIRQKYLGHLGDPVVAVMVPPLGFRLEVPVALT